MNNSQPIERSASSPLQQRLELTTGAAGARSSVSGEVLYEAGDGYSVKFTDVSGLTTAFTPAEGVNADLAKTSIGHTLTMRTTREVSTFNVDGQVLSVADRNDNKTTYTYTGGVISKITGFSGGACDEPGV